MSRALPLRGIALCLALLPPCLAAASPTIVVNGTGAGRVFEGIGAVSAGSSRLLIDYPEPQRSQILDYLFKPNYGAALQHLKVEVGGDGNSNAVAEPSHMHAPNDHDWQRGYEWWLMEEAKRRNPGMLLSALAWNFPGWVRAADSQATADYLIDYLRGAKQVHGLDIDYLGLWNETSMPTAFIPRLQQTLRAAGIKTQIIADDSVNSWGIVRSMEKEPTVRGGVAVAATHYPRLEMPAPVRALLDGWQMRAWSSEDGPWDDAWGAWGQQSKSYAEVLNRNYVDSRLTSTLLWSLATGYPDNLGLPRSGLLRANTPWSGHYEVTSPLWVIAHTTQFAQPGWHYLDTASGALPGGGSYVSLHQGSDFSIVVETMAAQRATPLTFAIRGGLARGPMHVWRTNRASAFEQLADVDASSGRFVYRFEAASVYTLTTTVGQHKGGAQGLPDAPFPLPYRDDFEGYRRGETNLRYWIAQNGSFEAADCGGGRAGRCARQVVTEIPVHWGAWGLSTEAGISTIAGHPHWRNYRIAADVLIEDSGYAMLVGRVVKNDCDGPLQAYQFRLYDDGRWELHAAVTAGLLASGKTDASRGIWRRLELEFEEKRITARIDGVAVLALEDVRNPYGMAGFGSGWNQASFDNVTIAPLAPGARVMASAGDDASALPVFEPALLLPMTGDRSVTLRWTAVPNATGYRLRVSTRAEGPPDRDLDVGPVLTRTFHQLHTGVRYYFWVLARNGAGAGNPSYPQSAVP